jgi:hypothetical protein
MTDLAAKVTELYGKERHDAPVTKASEAPTSYSAITTEWLTDVLCPDMPGTRVASFRLDERDDGSSNRRRIFLTYENGKEGVLPATVFCKLAETLETRLVLGISGAGEAETNFYNKVRPRLKMEAPTAHYANYDPGTYASIVMLRDLAGEVTFCDDRTDIDWNRAVSLVTNLADLHAPFYQSPELGTETIPFRTWHRWWRDMMVASPQFAVYCDKAFGDSEELMPPRLFRRRPEIWPATDQSVARHEVLPHTLIHCDVHLKNWYITRAGGMGLSDWQNTAIGHWARDYIYATVTALTVENRRQWERELFRIYRDAMAERGVPPISEEDGWLNLRQQLFTALAFWTITLRPAPGMPDMQPERTARAFLRRLYAAIDDHDALDSFR